MEKTRAVILPAYNDNLIRAMLGLKVGEKDLRPLKGEEVLVEMEGAPCNPSDIAFLRGGYNIVKPLPSVPGFEGSGTVVEAGKGAESMLGKRVSCFIQEDYDGTWADHFIARKKDCIVVKEGIDSAQASCLSINPLTAWAMFDLVLEKGCRAFIQNAAGGQVPQIMHDLARINGIRVINLVRKQEQVEKLKSAGREYVLDTNDESFKQNLMQLAAELKPTLAFDAVGGELSGIMLNAMPEGSGLMVYGGLSGAGITGIDPMGVIFRGKYVRGFNLNTWLTLLTEDEFAGVTGKVQDMILSGAISTRIQATYPLDRVVEGLRAYIKSMSEGKILFTP